MKIAKRLQGISPSPTLAVMQEAQALRKQGVDIIDLGPGEPDFPTPENVKQAGIDAIQANHTKYTAGLGISELREAVAEKYNKAWGSDYTASNVAITCGAKHAIYNFCMTRFEDGDQVLIPTPYWVTFPEVVRITGAEPVTVPTNEAEGFVLQASQVESACNEATRGLIINTPNNPSGAVIPENDFRAIADVCSDRQVALLSDETYEYFVYEEHRHFSLAALSRADDHNFAIVGSLSKTYSMTGWRIGYLVGHVDMIRKVGALQSHQTGNPTSVSQYAGLAALESPLEVIAAMKQEYESRRRLVLDLLAEIPGFSCAEPFGAFYAYPNVSEAIAATGMQGSVEFSRFLIQDAQVATVPGAAFGTEGFVRLSYATSMENLQEGLGRIRKSVENAMKRPAGA